MKWSCSLCKKEIPLLSQDYMLLAYPIQLDDKQLYMSPIETPIYVCKSCLLSEFADVDPHIFTTLRRLGLVWSSMNGTSLAPCK